MVSKMLCTLSMKLKAKDIVENLDTVVTWWNKISSYEQEVKSKRRKKTSMEQHWNMEKLFVSTRVTPRNFGASLM